MPEGTYNFENCVTRMYSVVMEEILGIFVKDIKKLKKTTGLKFWNEI